MLQTTLSGPVARQRGALRAEGGAFTVPLALGSGLRDEKLPWAVPTPALGSLGLLLRLRACR